MTERSLSSLRIRTELKPGDAGEVTRMHGRIYTREFGFGPDFEHYVAEAFAEFEKLYNPGRNRVWACEHDDKLIGYLVLMDRGSAAQLRLFIMEPAYRGIGLGKHLMNLFMDFARECNYKTCYLWTTDELQAAASLYKRHGFMLTETKPSTSFGKSLVEHRYDVTL